MWVQLHGVEVRDPSCRDESWMKANNGRPRDADSDTATSPVEIAIQWDMHENHNGYQLGVQIRIVISELLCVNQTRYRHRSFHDAFNTLINFVFSDVVNFLSL